jgi:hypothetical protein
MLIARVDCAGAGHYSNFIGVLGRKLQNPKSKQIPNPKEYAAWLVIVSQRHTHDRLFGIWSLKFGAYLDLGSWDLELLPHCPRIPPCAITRHFYSSPANVAGAQWIPPRR